MIGHDTEYFIWDPSTRSAVPAHECGIGKKGEGKKEVDTYGMWGYQGCWFRDGYAVELNSPPVTCRAYLWEYQAGLLSDLLNYLKSKFKFTLTTKPWVKVDLKKHILGGPPDVQELGCNPTFDPYIKQQKEIDVDPKKLPFRTCGAHLHMSVGKKLSLTELAILAKYSDLLLGLPFSVIFNDPLEFKRRKLYGTAGEFRAQKYDNGMLGFEYRTLSSRLYHHPALFSLFSGIWKYVLAGRYTSLIEEGWNKKLDDPLRKAINTGEGGVELLEEFAGHLKKYTLGYGYTPKDWGQAILTLRKWANQGKFNEPLILKNRDAHTGWTEYNTEKWPTGKDEPWRL